MLIVSLIGATGGIYALSLAKPLMDFYYLMPVFILLGVITANAVLLVIFYLLYDAFKNLKLIDGIEETPELNEVPTS
jgi:Ni/Fe-hydrogenase subunit HybB-like protein